MEQRKNLENKMLYVYEINSLKKNNEENCIFDVFLISFFNSAYFNYDS